jgi:thymidine kinase
MSLELFWGPMFSGKTTALISKLTRHADVGMRCLYINHSKDVRLSESADDIVTTHNSSYQKLSKKVDGIKTNDLDAVEVDDYDIIGIDEGQFFSGIVPIIRRWVLVLGKRVFIASLDSDYLLRPFGETHLLTGLCPAGSITKFAAICKRCDPKDLRDAGYTLKIAGGDTQVDVGGADKYVPVCLTCHKLYNKYTY